MDGDIATTDAGVSGARVNEAVLEESRTSVSEAHIRLLSHACLHFSSTDGADTATIVNDKHLGSGPTRYRSGGGDDGGRDHRSPLGDQLGEGFENPWVDGPAGKEPSEMGVEVVREVGADAHVALHRRRACS